MDLLDILLLFAISHNVLAINSRVDIPEDATLTFNELAHKYTQKGEEYDLTVEDGYILKLFRIPGDETKPILLIHGLAATADSFIERGNTSLAVALSRQNYDVWAINVRGNRYSRRHTTMNPDTDKNYWNFSIHEHGYYDLAGTIDFILNKTKQTQLTVIGYSQGTTAMYVLGATRPEYNDKIKLFISLGSICYLQHTQLYLSLLIEVFPILNEGFITFGQEEILGYKSKEKAMLDDICLHKHTGYDTCFQKGLFLVAGSDANTIESSFLPVILGHAPAGTSRKNLLHYIQIRENNRFAMYDYGVEGNMAKYNRSTSPEYDMNKLTMKIAIVAAKYDKISTITDVSELRQQLPNVVEYRVLKNNAFSHIDYIWGRNTNRELFPYIFKFLNKYQ